jgi:glucose-1-phosphate adenylyltransferase
MTKRWSCIRGGSWRWTKRYASKKQRREGRIVLAAALAASLAGCTTLANIFGGTPDIGTVRAFFEANLALAQPLPPFDFFDASEPIYTQDRYLPAAKLNKCAIDHVVIGDGSIITDSSLHHCVLGVRSYVGEGSVLEDAVIMGADFYETPAQLKENASLGRPRMGIGARCVIKGAIVDKNTRIGEGCVLVAAGKADGTYANGAVVIRDGVLVVPKGAILPAGTVV